MPDPIGGVAPAAPHRSTAITPAGRFAETSFAQVLADRQAVRFSAHAQQRLTRRGIDLDAGDLERLNQAVDRAGAKGGRESLVLLDELALIVSIDNRTVITALDTGAAQGNVFTNVDSVVIAPRETAPGIVPKG